VPSLLPGHQAGSATHRDSAYLPHRGSGTCSVRSRGGGSAGGQQGHRGAALTSPIPLEERLA
jgi:hypothetical protein